MRDGDYVTNLEALCKTLEDENRQLRIQLELPLTKDQQHALMLSFIEELGFGCKRSGNGSYYVNGQYVDKILKAVKNGR